MKSDVRHKFATQFQLVAGGGRRANLGVVPLWSWAAGFREVGAKIVHNFGDGASR